MSTSSTIGILMPNRTVPYIRVHWGGHPWALGATLLGHYVTTAAVTELIGLGDCSSVGKAIGQRASSMGRSLEPEAWQTLESEQCLAHHRDEGRPLRRCASVGVRDFLYDAVLNEGAEFAYLFDPQRGWQYRSLRGVYMAEQIRELLAAQNESPASAHSVWDTLTPVRTLRALESEEFGRWPLWCRQQGIDPGDAGPAALELWRREYEPSPAWAAQWRVSDELRPLALENSWRHTLTRYAAAIRGWRAIRQAVTPRRPQEEKHD